jgi:hypothetical protein
MMQSQDVDIVVLNYGSRNLPALLANARETVCSNHSAQTKAHAVAIAMALGLIGKADRRIHKSAPMPIHLGDTV